MGINLIDNTCLGPYIPGVPELQTAHMVRSVLLAAHHPKNAVQIFIVSTLAIYVLLLDS